MINIQPKKALFITPCAAPNIGGIETHVELLSEYLCQHGYQIIVLTYQPLTSHISAPPYEEKASRTIYRFRWLKSSSFSTTEGHSAIFNFIYLTPYLLLRSLWFMLFHHKEIDVIHVFGLNTGIIGLILKLLFRKRIVMSVKGIYGFHGYGIIERMVQWIISRLDIILVGSLDSKDDFLNLGISPDKLVLYTYWVDHERFKPRDKLVVKKQLMWEEAFTVLYIGRLVPSKGIQVIVEAAKQLPRVNFKIIGDGILRQQVITASRKYPNIEYVGILNYQNMPIYLQAADLLIYPVMYHDEASLAILESLACGTPVVSSNRGSSIYRLADEFSMVVTPTREAIKQSIDWLREHPDQLADMSRRAASFSLQFKSELARVIMDTYQ